jgi:hypothetical protein
VTYIKDQESRLVDDPVTTGSKILYISLKPVFTPLHPQGSNQTSNEKIEKILEKN